MPKVAGILLETALGCCVEIVLFMVLIKKDNGTGNVTGKGDLIPVIQAAILGSILTNILLCLGLCFFVGGLKRTEQKFHAAISEAGSGLLLVAGFGLLIPSAFFAALKGSTVADGHEGFTQEKLRINTRKISQATSVILLLAFLIYVFYNSMSHDGVLTEALEADEERDEDRHEDLAKPKFTFTECIIALVISLTCVTLIAIFLVEEIGSIVAMGVPDNFMGLILVPLVEKAAEHLTAVDEAWDNQIVRTLRIGGLEQADCQTRTSRCTTALGHLYRQHCSTRLWWSSSAGVSASQWISTSRSSWSFCSSYPSWW